MCPAPLQGTAQAPLAEVDVAAALQSAGVHGVQEPAARGVVFPSVHEWWGMTARARYDWIVEHVRGFWCTKVLDVGEVVRAAVGERSAAARFTAKRKAFAQLPNEEKVRVVALWVQRSGAPEYVADRAKTIFVAGVGRRRAGPKTVLLTFVGPWTWRAKDGVVRHTGDLTLAEVVHVLQRDAAVCDLWSNMRRHADMLLSRVQAADLACCLEVCPRTFEEEHVARLHLHVFLRAPQRMSLPPLRLLDFEGAVPVVADVVGGLPTSRQSGSWAGYLYCIVEKFGQVFSYGTKRPFKDFLVQGQWVLNLLQARKISLPYARELVLQSCHNVQRHVKELDMLAREHEKERVAAARRVAECGLAMQRKRWRSVRAVVDWHEQYKSEAFRYKFLVLDGPSKLGKTQFAKSFVESSDQLLELNCAAGQEPDLRGFRYGQHEVVLFDEIRARIVAQQRKLFQACAAEVQLGCSATNCHSYTVFLFRVKLVLCSNSWAGSMEELCEEDQAWLRENMVYVAVQEPLWCEEC